MRVGLKGFGLIISKMLLSGGPTEASGRVAVEVVEVPKIDGLVVGVDGAFSAGHSVLVTESERTGNSHYFTPPSRFGL